MKADNSTDGDVPPSGADMHRNLQHAIQTQQKFEFYFLSLVFTLLGLSVQTSEFLSPFQAGCEIGAWPSFLVSGLAGLSRMQWIPVFYKGHSELIRRKTFLQEADTGCPLRGETGQMMADAEANQFVKQVAERTTEIEATMQGMEKRHWVKTFAHKWFFVGALVLLMVSRGVGLWHGMPKALP